MDNMFPIGTLVRCVNTSHYMNNSAIAGDLFVYRGTSRGRLDLDVFRHVDTQTIVVLPQSMIRDRDQPHFEIAEDTKD